MYASSFSSFETRENIDLEGGGPVPRGLVKTLGNSTDRSDSLDDHVDDEDNPRVHGIDQIELVSNEILYFWQNNSRGKNFL